MGLNHEGRRFIQFNYGIFIWHAFGGHVTSGNNLLCLLFKSNYCNVLYDDHSGKKVIDRWWINAVEQEQLWDL